MDFSSAQAAFTAWTQCRVLSTILPFTPRGWQLRAGHSPVPVFWPTEVLVPAEPWDSFVSVATAQATLGDSWELLTLWISDCLCSGLLPFLSGHIHVVICSCWGRRQHLGRPKPGAQRREDTGAPHADCQPPAPQTSRQSLAPPLLNYVSFVKLLKLSFPSF